MDDGAMLIRSQTYEVDSELKLPLLEVNRRDRKIGINSTGPYFAIKKGFKNKETKRKENNTCKLYCRIYFFFLGITLKEMIKLESSYNSKLFSLKSSLVFIITLLIASSQLAIYRKVTNYITDNLREQIFKSEVLNEVLIYCWRTQAILLLCFVYLIAVYFISKKISKSKTELQANNFDYLKFHIKTISWKNTISVESLKLGLVNAMSTFLLFCSTNYMPFGFTSLSNNLGIVVSFLINFNKKEYLFKKEKLDRIIRTLVGVMSFFGLILILYPIFDFKHLIGFYMCLGSLIINLAFVKPIISEYYKTTTPLEVIFIQLLNTFLCSTLILLILQTIHNELNFTTIISWLVDIRLLAIILLTGLLGFIYIASIVFVSILLKPAQISSLKYLEVLFSDLFGSFILNIYPNPFSIYYVLGIFQIFTGMFLADLFTFVS